MFGLVFLIGFAFMIFVIMCTIAVLIFVCVKLKINVFASVGISLLITGVFLYLTSAHDINETRRFNALCKSNGGRHVSKVVEGVNDVRLVGRFSPFDQRYLGEKFELVEWEQNGEKWCHYKEVAPGYGNEFRCATNSFVARYEVRRATSINADHVRSYEERIVDSVTGEELGHEISYYIESESGQEMDASDLFFAAWHTLSWLIVTRDEFCDDYHRSDFVYEILKPKLTSNE